MKFLFEIFPPLKDTYFNIECALFICPQRYETIQLIVIFVIIDLLESVNLSPGPAEHMRTYGLVRK